MIPPIVKLLCQTGYLLKELHLEEVTDCLALVGSERLIPISVNVLQILIKGSTVLLLQLRQ